jgi:hypothetical protein
MNEESQAAWEVKTILLSKKNLQKDRKEEFEVK